MYKILLNEYYFYKLQNLKDCKQIYYNWNLLKSVIQRRKKNETHRKTGITSFEVSIFFYLIQL